MGELIGKTATDKDNMKQELIKPGSSHNRFVIGDYRMRIRTTNFEISENSAFILGTGIYGTTPLGSGTPTTVIDDNFDQRFTTTGRGEITAWLNGDAATEITHIDFGFGTDAFTTADTGITALRTNCIAYWNFDQNPAGGAPQLTDQAGSNDGTSVGTMLAGDEVAGKLGNAWDFEGTDDNVDIPVSADFVFTTNGLSGMAWVKPTSTADC